MLIFDRSIQETIVIQDLEILSIAVEIFLSFEPFHNCFQAIMEHIINMIIKLEIIETKTGFDSVRNFSKI